MKILLSVLTFAFALFAPAAQAWQTVLVCDSGTTVLELEGNAQNPYQLVIRDHAVAQYLMNTSAIDGFRKNSSGEVIIPLRLKPTSSPFAPEFIGAADAYRVDGRVMFVKAQGEYLTLEAFRTTQPSGGIYVQHEKMADWTFRGCK